MSFMHFSESEIILADLMNTLFTNFGGKDHGGVFLSLMDKVAYVYAIGNELPV